MSPKDRDSVHKLREEIQDLPLEERKKLLAVLQEEQLRDYIKTREEHLDELYGKNLIAQSLEGNLRTEPFYDSPSHLGTRHPQFGRRNFSRAASSSKEPRQTERHLEGFPSSGGCAEAWEYLSAYRNQNK